MVAKFRSLNPNRGNLKLLLKMFTLLFQGLDKLCIAAGDIGISLIIQTKAPTHLHWMNKGY
ncbi:hypothetical protein QCA50_009439 [Cerrena zonata]|uniref:Uncharacterized protein n=1 Tax=Cerrena zonata TaxID=2478898 RepID=A0AAW0G3P3_9APHY